MAASPKGEESPLIIAGVDRSKGSSFRPKVVFALLHAIAVGVSAWILQGGGVRDVGEWFGKTGEDAWDVLSPRRAALLTASLCIFFVRHVHTLVVLIQRRVMWAEALPLGIMMLAIYAGSALLCAGVTWPADRFGDGSPVADFTGFACVLFGSFLTWWSELQRHMWKKNPENKGHCYTGGLWRFSMHINYLGETFSWSGITILSATWWMMWNPLLMTAGFVWYHIPGLDSYLEKRYGDEFREYAARTKKFVPWVW